jgi:TRAP transporter TAXI family solute receptor
MKRKEILFALAVLVLIGALSAPRLLKNWETGAPSRLRIATGGSAGVYFKYGEALAGVIGKKTNSDATVISSGGSVDNIRLLRGNRAEFAFVQNDIMTYAYNGTDIFSIEGPFKDFSAVAGLYPEVCQIVARAGIAGIDELKGRRVSIGDEGSGTERNAIQILSSYGMSEADIYEDHLSFEASVKAFREGKIDAFFCTAGVPTPAVSDLAASEEIVLLNVGEAHARFLIEQFPYYSRHTIRGGSYPGINGDAEVVAVRATLVARSTVSAEDVFAITKLLFDDKQEIARACEEANALERETALNGIPIPLHAGAEKFYFGK